MSYVEELGELLKKSAIIDGSTSLAFSGGLDSGILAFLIPNSNLYVVGTRNSRDISYAILTSSLIKKELNVLLLEMEDIIEFINLLLEVDESINIVEISFEIPLMKVLKESREDIVVSGQGADELFGGYFKYLRKPELMLKDLDKLLNVTIPRERNIARFFRKRIYYPYLNEKIIEFATNLPLDLKIKDNIRKYILRETAKYLGLPKEIYEAKKSASQYGSGVMKILRALSKRYKCNLRDLPKRIKTTFISHADERRDKNWYRG